MMNFSERKRYKKTRADPLGQMDSILKNDIWTFIFNIIHSKYIKPAVPKAYPDYYRAQGNPAKEVWLNFFNKSIDQFPNAECFLSAFKALYDDLKWNGVYDLLEYILGTEDGVQKEEFKNNVNKILEKNNANYRIINNMVQPIISENSKLVIEKAQSNSQNEITKAHLIKAEKLYSDRKHPDFDTSCLESVKAVESCCRLLLNNQKILSENIKKLKKDSRFNRHIVDILAGISNFRGDVVAHAKKENSYYPSRQDAEFFYTICCTFVNYLNSTADSAEKAK